MAANTALQNAEWKAATVLGGAAIETLLYWKLSPPQTPQSKRDDAAKKLNVPSADFDRWDLSNFIAVAKELRAIGECTFKQPEMARDYRNLIHPGRASRKKQLCNRATALAAISGLQHVIDDLERPTP